MKIKSYTFAYVKVGVENTFCLRATLLQNIKTALEQKPSLVHLT